MDRTQQDNSVQSDPIDAPSLIPGSGHSHCRSRWVGSVIILALIVAFVGYGLYRFQLRPAITMYLPGHAPQPLDAPPLELTSFQMRLDGQDVVPAALAFKGDSLYVSLIGVPAIQVYDSQLKLLKTIRLDRPSSVIPNAIAVTESLLIVSDSAGRQVVLYDREGDFSNLIQWYPDKSGRITPASVSSDGRRLAVIDDALNKIALISLVDEQPYLNWLELLELFPRHQGNPLIEPRFALLSPDDKIWVGETDQIRIFSLVGNYQLTAEPPPKTRIIRPIAATIAADSHDSTCTRIHVLDRVAGKVFVYDLAGSLRLVYPRDRALQRPSSIALDTSQRTIFIAENDAAAITVFGF